MVYVTLNSAMYQQIKALFFRSRQEDLATKQPGYMPGPHINATTVNVGYIPTQSDAVWVSDGDVKEFMQNGYSFCPHPDGGEVCVRFHNEPPERLLMDWLLVPPKGRGDV